MSNLYYIAPKQYYDVKDLTFNSNNMVNIDNFINHLGSVRGKNLEKERSSNKKSLFRNFTVKNNNPSPKKQLIDILIKDIKNGAIKDYFNCLDDIDTDKMDDLNTNIDNGYDFVIFMTDLKNKKKINGFCIVSFSNGKMVLSNMYFRRNEYQENMEDLISIMAVFKHKYGINLDIDIPKKPFEKLENIIKKHTNINVKKSKSNVTKKSASIIKKSKSSALSV